MNRGLVDLAELRNNFDEADFKHGKSSYCFIRGNKIIKVYATKFGENFIPKKVCDFSKFSADTIVFPDEYIYENKFPVAEIADYIKSREVCESFDDNAKIKRIIDSFELVINDLNLYQDIDMADLCYVNILYSNKLGFHIIDTTEWQFAKNSYKVNLYRLNMALIDALIDYLELPIIHSKYYSEVDDKYIKNIDKYGSAGKELKSNIDLLMHNRYDFLRFLYAYMDAYRAYSGTDAENLKDINEFTKVLKKS